MTVEDMFSTSEEKGNSIVVEEKSEDEESSIDLSLDIDTSGEVLTTEGEKEEKTEEASSVDKSAPESSIIDFNSMYCSNSYYLVNAKSTIGY